MKWKGALSRVATWLWSEPKSEAHIIKWFTATQTSKLLADKPCSPGWVDALRELGEEGITYAVEPDKIDGSWWIVERPDHFTLLVSHGVEPDHIWTRWALAILLEIEPTIGRYTLPQLASNLVGRLGPHPRVPVASFVPGKSQ